MPVTLMWVRRVSHLRHGAGRDAVDEGLALGELLLHAAAAVVVGRPVAVVALGLLPATTR